MGPSSLPIDGVYQVCSGPLIPSERWGLSIDSASQMRWTNNPVCSGPLIPSFAWKMRFTQCATSPSSILRDEVYLVCSGPIVPPKRLGLPPERWVLLIVQSAPHLWLCLIDEVYLVSSGQRWVLLLVQSAPHLWLCLIDEVHLVSSGPSHPFWEMRFTQCAVSPSSLTLPERWGLPSVQWAPHP